MDSGFRRPKHRSTLSLVAEGVPKPYSATWIEWDNRRRSLIEQENDYKRTQAGANELFASYVKFAKMTRNQSSEKSELVDNILHKAASIYCQRDLGALSNTAFFSMMEILRERSAESTSERSTIVGERQEKRSRSRNNGNVFKDREVQLWETLVEIEDKKCEKNPTAENFKIFYDSCISASSAHLKSCRRDARPSSRKYAAKAVGAARNIADLTQDSSFLIRSYIHHSSVADSSQAKELADSAVRTGEHAYAQSSSPEIKSLLEQIPI